MRLIERVATMCSSASGKSASPHCSTMKPIWATVDQASEVLMADWVSITSPPSRAVKPPINTSAARAPGVVSSRSAKRISRKPPALMMPACSRAETGVGASMTSTSQPWAGNWADFEQRRHDQERHRPAGSGGHRPTPRLSQDRADVHRAVAREQEQAGQDTRAIRQPGDDELLSRRALRRGPPGIEQQQPVQAEAGRDPGDHKLQQIAGAHEQKRGGERGADPAREAALPRFAGEIAAAEAQDDPADEGDQQQHGDADDVEAHTERPRPRGAAAPASRGRTRRAERGGKRHHESEGRGDLGQRPLPLRRLRLAAQQVSARAARIAGARRGSARWDMAVSRAG